MAINLKPASLVSGSLESWEYLASYGDLINAFGANSSSAASHYNTYGKTEGRAITFDAWGYLASYGDLIDAFGTNVINAAKHYVTYGYGEGRLVTFDAEAYLANYSDLQAAFNGNTVLAEQHYVTFGRSEGRIDYSVDASATSVQEGGTISFTLDTKDLAQGTVFHYTLSGVSADDVVGGQLQGLATVQADHTAVVSVTLANDALAAEGESIAFSIDEYASILKTDEISITDNTSYTLSANATSVQEGNTVYFTLQTTGVPAGSSFAYTLTGVQSDDVLGGNLSGVATVGTDGKAVVAVSLLADGKVAEGESVTLTLDDYPSITKTVTVTDMTSYTLTALTPKVTEGDTAYFQLAASTVPAGSQFVYAISGVDEADVVGGSLTGVATVGADGKAIIQVSLVADGISETEKVTVTLLGYTGVSAQATIEDPVAYRLTVNADIGADGEGVEAENFIAVPETSIAGFSVNTLQDEDILVGLGDNAVLNATIGNTLFDNTEELISPTMTNVKTVNVNLNSGDLFGIGFASTDGVEAINIKRLADNQGSAHMVNIQESTDSLGISNVETDGNVFFNYDEGQIEGLSDELTLTLSNVRLGMLGLTQGDFMPFDSYEDEGFGFEEINVVVNGNTNIDAFFINENFEEGVEQSVTFDVNAALEINHLIADGAEDITIHAGADVVIADDEDSFGNVYNDGISTADLETLTIDGDGDVMIDGLDGGTVHVNGSAMEGDLQLGVTYGTAASSGTLIESGAGDDLIVTYGSLGGDVSTNGGNDVLQVGGDFYPTVEVDMGEGNDEVSGYDMLAYGDDIPDEVDYDHVPAIAASIDLGNGDNSAAIGEMHSAVSWNDWATYDNDNDDDTYMLVGAEITGGTGNDTVSLIVMEEQAVIGLDGGNDDVIFNSENLGSGGSGGHYGMPAVMWGDSQNDQERVNIDDENAEEDILGAQVYLGEGNNTITFNDSDLEFIANYNNGSGDSFGKDILLMGEGALVEAGSGSDTFNVNFVNDVTVAAKSSWGTYNPDMQKMIVGIDTINLTAAKVSNVTSDFGASNDASVELDVLRVDSALDTINLVSLEDVSQTSDVVHDEDHTPGNPVYFTLDNLREAVDVNLTAQEASGVYNEHVQDDGNIWATDSGYNAATETTAGEARDGVYGIDYYMYNEVANDARIVDVYLTVNNDDQTSTSDSDTFELDVTADSGAFDLSLRVTDSMTDLGYGSADPDDVIENVIINFADDNSHYINMQNFGDSQHTDNPTTSLKVNSAAGAGEVITVVNVTADTIAFKGIDGNSPIAADVRLSVGESIEANILDVERHSDSAANTYNITTGTGNDVIDMREDDVNASDTISGGAGRDVLVVSGDDSLGNNNLGGYPATPDTVGSPYEDDDMWETVTGFEVITIDTDQGVETGGENWSGGESGSGYENYNAQKITFDEETDEFNRIDTINIIGTDVSFAQTHALDLVIGDDYHMERGKTLTIDSRMHYDTTTIQIDNREDDELEQQVGLNVLVNTEGGTQLNFVRTGNEDIDVNVTVLTSDEGITNITEGAGTGEGQVRIEVQEGSFDTLTLQDGLYSPASEGTNPEITIVIADSWTRDNGSFTVDASAIADTDGNLATGGASIYFATASDTVNTVTINGTQNSDYIAGHNEKDIISGNGGNDSIYGGLGLDELHGGDGADYISGGDGADSIYGDAGADDIDGDDGDDLIVGGEGNDTIDGDHGADNMTGGAGNDVFEYWSADDSTGLTTEMDTITGFNAADDSFDFSHIASSLGYLGVLFAGTGLTENAAETNLSGDNLADGLHSNDYLEAIFVEHDQMLYVDINNNGDIDTGDMAIHVTVTGSLADANFIG